LIGYIFLKLLKADISKKIEICFHHWFGTSNTKPPCDGFPLRFRPYCRLIGCDWGKPLGWRRETPILLERIANWI